MWACARVSAYHPSASLHCQPLWGGLICIVAVQLQNHNKISHECILGDISQMSSRLRLHTKYLGRACAQSIRSTSRFLCLRLNSAHPMLCFMHVPFPLLDNRKRRSSTIVCAYSNIFFFRVLVSYMWLWLLKLLNSVRSLNITHREDGALWWWWMLVVLYKFVLISRTASGSSNNDLNPNVWV